MRAGTRRGHASHFRKPDTSAVFEHSPVQGAGLLSLDLQGNRVRQGEGVCAQIIGAAGPWLENFWRAASGLASSRILTSAVSWLMLSVRAEMASSWAKARVALRASLRSKSKGKQGTALSGHAYGPLKGRKALDHASSGMVF